MRSPPHPPDHSRERPLCDREGSDPSHNALLSEGPPGAATRRAALRSRAEGRQRFCGGFRGPVDPVEALTFPGLAGSWAPYASTPGQDARHGDVTLPETCQPQGGGTLGGWMGPCPPLFTGQRKQGFPGGCDSQDEIQICGSRRFPSSCYSKTKCFTHLGSIIKYRSVGWSVVGANFFQFAERLVTRPLKRTCQKCFACANAACKHSSWFCGRAAPSRERAGLEAPELLPRSRFSPWCL